MSSDTGPAPFFGADSGFTAGHTLPPGQVLRDYRIDAVLGEGGFGIVYLALDTALERRVAIKEYLPSAMATRASSSLTVIVKSAGHRETFEAGLRSFVNEARLLARFDHPALVKVHQFWEQNGTAYMVMPYYEGPTLKRTLATLGRPPTEAELKQWLLPLLDALAVLHAERCFHRDIAPDNILITANGPLLLDFGAARRVIGDMTQALTAVLKPGFAPIEQYGEVPGMAQGAWTDIFALASVLYVALAGVKPMSSIERVMDDRLRPLSQMAAGRASPAFLHAVDHALALRPADRPQTVAEFLAELGGPDVDPERTLPLPAPLAPRASPPRAPLPAIEPTAFVDLGFDPVEPAAVAAAPELPAPAAPAVTSRRRAIVWSLAGGGAVLAAATAAWQRVGRREAGEQQPASPVDATPVTPAPAAMATPAPAPVAAPAPAPEPAPAATEPSPAPAAAPPSEPVAAPPARQAAAARPPARTADKPAAERPAAAQRKAATQTRCSDILQKASLEPITAAEADFLKRECR